MDAALPGVAHAAVQCMAWPATPTAAAHAYDLAIDAATPAAGSPGGSARSLARPDGDDRRRAIRVAGQQQQVAGLDRVGAQLIG